jgi:dimethylglycine dehydrogenase
MSFIGEHGLELHVERDHVARLYEKLHEVDPKLGDWGGTTMNSFRIEKGVPLFGKDITKDHDAFEAGLDRFVKLDKGDFIGRDALLKVKEAGGPTRKIMNLEVAVGEEKVDCTGNEPLRCTESGKVVGFTTSGTWGCLSGKSLALGYVYDPERWADGTRLHVDILGKKVDCFVREKAAMSPAAVRDRKAAAAVKAAAEASARGTASSSAQQPAAMHAAAPGKA